MERYRPGTLAPNSGVYAVLDENGRTTGRKISLGKDTLFPPTPKPGWSYALKHEIVPVHTSVASTVVLTATGVEYSDVIKELAKR